MEGGRLRRLNPSTNPLLLLRPLNLRSTAPSPPSAEDIGADDLLEDEILVMEDNLSDKEKVVVIGEKQNLNRTDVQVLR